MPAFADAVAVTLPGGYRDAAGEWQRRAWLRPWRPADAEELAPFERTFPARQASALLGLCLSLDGSHAAGSEVARALSVGDREALLLQLRSLTVGNKLSTVIRCPSCAEKMDLDLALTDLLLPPYDAAQPTYVHEIVAGDVRHEVRFRLPNGADQEAVAERAQHDLAGAVQALVERCVESIDGEHAPQISAPVVAGLADVMAGLDPQAELMLSAECPACQAAFETLLDATSVVVRELEEARRQLYRDVHLLASHYHWSEEQILALSDRKRQLYLELIHAEWHHSRRQAS
ncbi:MAG TPA: hypothetical protein VI197_33445 [Polyangiaceae bacterium]